MGPCNCTDRCWHKFVGPTVRAACPVMCKVCGPTTTTTTTTTTTVILCFDDPICPTLVDNDLKPLCQCQSIGDIVRAACPVMCKECNQCTLPCLTPKVGSFNL